MTTSVSVRRFVSGFESESLEVAFNDVAPGATDEQLGELLATAARATDVITAYLRSRDAQPITVTSVQTEAQPVKVDISAFDGTVTAPVTVDPTLQTSPTETGRIELIRGKGNETAAWLPDAPVDHPAMCRCGECYDVHHDDANPFADHCEGCRCHDCLKSPGLDYAKLRESIPAILAEQVAEREEEKPRPTCTNCAKPKDPMEPFFQTVDGRFLCPPCHKAAAHSVNAAGPYQAGITPNKAGEAQAEPAPICARCNTDVSGCAANRDGKLYCNECVRLVSMEEKPSDALKVLDEILKHDPLGESAFYKTAFKRAVEIGAITADGEPVEAGPAPTIITRICAVCQKPNPPTETWLSLDDSGGDSGTYLCPTCLAEEIKKVHADREEAPVKCYRCDEPVFGGGVQVAGETYCHACIRAKEAEAREISVGPSAEVTIDADDIPSDADVKTHIEIFGVAVPVPPMEWANEPMTKTGGESDGGQCKALNTVLGLHGYEGKDRHWATLAIISQWNPMRAKLTSLNELTRAEAHVALSWFDAANGGEDALIALHGETQRLKGQVPLFLTTREKVSA